MFVKVMLSGLRLGIKNKTPLLYYFMVIMAHCLWENASCFADFHEIIFVSLTVTVLIRSDASRHGSTSSGVYGENKCDKNNLLSLFYH